MAPTFTYNPDKDIPDLAGKVFFITGGTAGVGKEALLALVKHRPARIFFTGRSAKNAAVVIEAAEAIDSSVEVTHIQCDQESLASVRSAGDQFRQASDRLDVLVCNAGIMARPPRTTQDGYEIHFGINHVAHALLIRELLPVLQATAKSEGDARLLAITSLGFYLVAPGGIDYDALKTPQDRLFGRFLRYGQSKLANVAYANEVARRYADITVVSLHPGVIHATELQTGLPLYLRAFIRATTIGSSIEPHEGGYNTEWAATTAKDNLQTGGVYEPVGVVLAQSKYSGDAKFCGKLWDWTQTELDSFEGRSNRTE